MLSFDRLAADLHEELRNPVNNKRTGIVRNANSPSTSPRISASVDDKRKGIVRSTAQNLGISKLRRLQMTVVISG